MDAKPPELRENKPQLLKPSSVWHLVMAAQADSHRYLSHNDVVRIRWVAYHLPFLHISHPQFPRSFLHPYNHTFNLLANIQ